MGPTAHQGGRPLGIKKIETFFGTLCIFECISESTLIFTPGKTENTENKTPLENKSKIIY